MAVRYQAIWTSMDGIKYKIDIEDLDFSGSITAFNIGMESMDGFTLTYEGDQSNLTTLILPSSCTVNCVVENSAFETLINDIIGDQEGRFFFKIYKYESLGKVYNLIWAGLILADLIQMADLSFPYNCQLKAIDGLARLENIKYTGTPATLTTFTQYLADILSELEISQFWTTEEYLSTAVQWYNHAMFTTTPAAALDPLKVSGVYTGIFYELDSKGVSVGKNLYEILEQICLRWNARLFLAKGRFYFIQINELVNSTIYLRSYSKAGTYMSDTSAFGLGVSGFHRTGQYSFFRPLEKVSEVYNYKQTAVQINRLPYQANYETSLNIGLFAGGSGETALLSGNINISMTDNPLDVDFFWRFKLKIRIGNYYLSGNLLATEWSTDSASYVSVESMLILAIAQFENYNEIIEISLSIPEIPEIGSTDFQLYFDGFINNDTGGYYTPSAPCAWNKTYDSYDLKQTGTEGTAKTTAENTSPGTFFEKELPDTIIADGASSQSDGRIMVYNTTPAWVHAKGNWSVDGIGTPVFLNQLLTERVLALQATARRLYDGTIGGAVLWPFNTIEINSKKFAFLSGSLNANTNEWTAQWHEILET